MANSTHQRISQYKELCEKHKISKKNLLIIDVCTRWNSPYDMIIEAWEKRKVLSAISTTCQKYGNEIFLVTYEEWDLLNMSADELLAFWEATKIFFK